MRVEPFDIGSYVHVVKRGARGLPITRNKQDCERFVRLLYYLNDEFRAEFWEQDVRKLKIFERPKSWPARRPLVKILGWTLMPNHFHLLLKETQDDGVTRFMQSLCGSMTRHYNEKYEERGSIFQGAYRSRTIETDRYLRWAVSYVLVKNVFELYPGGYERAVKEFDKAWEWGTHTYAYSSLKDFAISKESPIVDFELLGSLFTSDADFKKCSRDMILSHQSSSNQGVSFE